jgi:hypothetical protein
MHIFLRNIYKDKWPFLFRIMRSTGLEKGMMAMKNRWMKLLPVLVLACLGTTAWADGIDEPIPSFYQEPGMSRTRDYVNQHPSERIDPFTGKLQYHFTDLFIPGNGGLDIAVQRSYSSLNEQIGEFSPVGMGWTMHFGRVIRKATNLICTNSNGPATEPVLELPDGGRRVLYREPGNASGITTWLTTDFWRAQCNLTASGGGLDVFSPDGTMYEMTAHGHDHYLNTSVLVVGKAIPTL